MTSMRLAIISDIHANLEALTAVLEDIDAIQADAVVCLGDVVGYGADPSACLEVTRAVSLFVLAGNHDFAAVGKVDLSEFNPYARAAALWTRDQLNNREQGYLSNLPLTREELGAFFVHGSPYRPERWNYILSIYEARRAFENFDEQVCFVGHSHAPIVLALNAKDQISVVDGAVVVFEQGNRYIVNVGSVGQPRDGDPRASYGVWDTGENRFELRRVAYDVQLAQKKILEAGLPEFLAYRLGVGQ